MHSIFTSLKTALGVFWRAFSNLFSDLKETIAGIAMMLIYKGTIEGSTITNVDFINTLITIGMFIIIWYGVIKILVGVVWKFLFGKSPEWKVGVLEILFRKLKPVYIQKVANMTDEELEETTDGYVQKLHKIRQKIFKNNPRRCCTLEKIKAFAKSFFKKLYANKKTNAAIGTVGAMVITGIAYFANNKWGLGLEETLGVQFIDLLAAEALATIGLVAPGVLGKGYESVDQFEKRIAEQKQAKTAKKQAKKEGSVVSPAQKAAKLAKKLHINEAAALQIVLEQEKAQKEALAKKNAAEESIIVAKLAKKLGISEAQAKIIRAEQLKNIAK